MTNITSSVRLRICFINNIVTPYTHRIFNEVALRFPVELTVISCSSNEVGRSWIVSEDKEYRHVILKGVQVHVLGNRNIYWNPQVFAALRRAKPDTIFISGYYPTMLMAVLYAVVCRVRYGVSMDGSIESDLGMRSRVHRFLRRCVVRGASAGIGASKKSGEWFRHFGLANGRFSLSSLLPGWNAPDHIPTFDERSFDLLWCGSLDDHTKGVLFFADVVKAVALKRPHLKVRVVGDGPERFVVERAFAEANIVAQFDGHLQQEQLLEAYSSAKVFLFPTRRDAWGLVANEAAQCGTPTIISPHAGAADELIVNDKTGYVVPRDVQIWTRCAAHLLEDKGAWLRLSDGAREITSELTVERSAAGMWNAFRRTQK